MESKILTPIPDAARDHKRANTMRILFFVVLLVVGYFSFNPLMNTWDLMWDSAEHVRADILWQQLIDAKAGTVFELDDGEMCIIVTPYLGGDALHYRCASRPFTLGEINKVRAVYVFGGTQWKAKYDEYQKQSNK